MSPRRKAQRRQGNGNAGGYDKEKGAGQGAAAEADTTETFVPAYTLPVREWVEYQYDAAGNRVRETSDLGATEYEYDAANRLVIVGVANAVDPSLVHRLRGSTKRPSAFMVFTGRVASAWLIAEGLYLLGVPLTQWVPVLRFVLVMP